MSRWRTKHEAMNQRRHIWACLGCRATYEQTRKVCDACQSPVQYFASTAEFRRYRELQVLNQGNAITDLSVQPSFKIVINGHLITEYRADFKYTQDGREVIEDVKGSLDPKHHDPVFLLKKKLVEAVYGISITVTK